MITEEITPIAFVDDHQLYRKGLINLLHSLDGNYRVVLEASNGKNFLESLGKNSSPKLAIVDIEMPGMNGFEVVQQMKEDFPAIPVLILTMYQDERHIIEMLKLGVKGFLSKDAEPSELRKALDSVSKGDFHHSELVSSKLIQALQSDSIKSPEEQFNDRELEFLKLCCSELTYVQIADQMHLSPKTIDGYRANLFERLDVKSRVGLVMYAIKQGIVSL